MEQKEKELLLKYLCAALPYGVKVNVKPTECFSSNCATVLACDASEDFCVWVRDNSVGDKLLDFDFWTNVEFVKPYLRSLSSMTGKERREFRQITDCAEITVIGFGYNEGGTLEEYTSSIPFHLVGLVFNWLLEHHFDFMGLIEKGLAIEVTESNNPYKD